MAESSPLSDGLIMIHKVISRALEVSLNKCDIYISKKGIPEDEKKGFLLYTTSLVRVMHSHHHGEDDIVFPSFTGRIDAPYDKLRQDHVSMKAMLDDLEKRIESVSDETLTELRDLLDVIHQAWGPHIRDEETSFSAERITAKMPAEEQKALADKVSRHGAKSSGPGPITLPFVIYNLRVSDRNEILAELPWILRKFLIPVAWRSKWKAMDPFLLN